MATSKIAVTEGSGKYLATNSISEDAVTKEISRVTINESDGSDTGMSAKLGALTETAPASDTASSGINGRLQRIAQNITSLIAATLKVAGAVAHDAVDSGNPIKIGARARSSEIAAVSSDDRSDLITDLVGKLIVLPYANPENFEYGVIDTAIVDTTSTAILAAAGVGVRHYVTSVGIYNSHATVSTFVKVLDGTTIMWEGYALAAGGGFNISFPTPLRGTANTAVNIQCVTTGANVKASVTAYKGA